MKRFMDEDFLLENETAKQLYHEYAAKMPILDFHSHVSPREIAEDVRYRNLAEAWLASDHYKWRLMRTDGVEEKYITGGKAAGRGAYLCPNPECLKKAIRSKALDRSLEVTIPEEVYQRLEKEMENG